MNTSDDRPAPPPTVAMPPATAVLLQYSRRRNLPGFKKPQPPPISSVFSRNRNKPVQVASSTIKRKTRDLPNTSECQACGFRIDLSSGRNRLQPLFSEWRVVLLCKKCISRVESSAVCSYCFDEVSDGFRCHECGRMIHESCFADYKSFPPWSYMGSCSDSSVCIDCWLPQQLARKRKLRRKRSSVKIRGSACPLECEKIKDFVDIVKSLRNVGKGSSTVGGSKNDGSMKFDDKIVEEDVALVNKSPEAKRHEGNAHECNEMVHDKAIEDVELALQLHRSMNASPRRSKMLCIDKNKMSIMVYRRIRKRPTNSTVGAPETGNAIDHGRIPAFDSEGLHDNLYVGSSVFPMACPVPSMNLHLLESNRLLDEGFNQEDSTHIVGHDEKDGNLHVPFKESERNSSNGVEADSRQCLKYDESVKLLDLGNIQTEVQHLRTYCKRGLNRNTQDRCHNFNDRIIHDELSLPSGNSQTEVQHLRTYSKRGLNRNTEDRCLNFYDRIIHDELSSL